jgi:O-antigen biosynthesis protein
MAEINKKLKIITGMHRSGTSALAKVFVDLGFDAGNNLIPADEDNPTGYWEDREIFNLNNHILSMLNLSWRQVENSAPRGVHIFSDKLIELFGQRAKELLNQKLNHSSKVLIKDPRFTILLPFWNRIFKEFPDTQMATYHIVRHPVAVAHSLQKRNGIPLSEGLKLWYHYNRSFFEDANPGFHLIHYEDLINQPEKTIEKITESVGLGLSKNLVASVQPALNHHFLQGDDFSDDLSGVAELLKIINRNAGTPEKIASEIRIIKFVDLLKASSDATKPKYNATLVVNIGESPPYVISQHTENIGSMVFDIESQLLRANSFSVYINDKPCGIQLHQVKIFSTDKVFTTKVTSGNFAFNSKSNYLFDCNQPHFDFDLPAPVIIKKVELSIAINELQENDLALIHTSLKLQNARQERSIRDLQAEKQEVLLSESPHLKELEKQKLLIAGQQNAIESLEKKSLWLYNELNNTRDSLSWRITLPLRSMQLLVNRIHNRFYILANDIGASYRLLRREGIGSFVSRFVWYLRGKRLKEEIEHSKLKPDSGNNPEPIIIDQNEKLTFGQPENLQVSIIIPVFNNALITWRCLKSIFINTSNVSYEVIVVDDHSTESLSPIAIQTTGIHLIRNSENLGFLKSCNKAAAQAKGRFICLLNNDTQVQEGWLEHLIAVFKKNKSAAIAGPKLVYPDGRLQEAGGIIWNNASAWNFGRYDDAQKPDYNYSKEVDYISGACLVIRKTVWNKVGGFDEQLTPAYYEDTDLAMKVRKAGYKIFYQPLAVVTHHEGASNGLNESSGLKKFQAVNRTKFYSKWEHELLVEASPNGMNVFFHRDRSLRKKHLLIIDHYVPMYDHDAGSRSTFGYLKLLVKMGFKIHFIGDNYFKHEPYTTALQQMGIEVLYGNFYQKNIRDWFRENGRYIDFVIAHRVHIAPKYFGMIRKFTSAKIAYVGHDLQYLGSRRKFEITGDKKFKKESAKFLKTETGIFNTVDVILPFSTYEEPHIKKLAPEKNVQVIPVYFFDNIPEKVPGFDERRDILFVGYFGHPPNPDAILWFVKEIFPLVQQKVPDAKLHVVGSQPTVEVLGLQNDFIKVTGYVSDEELTNYYHYCKVAILPLRFGAGVKGKLLESLNHQIPTVITPVAAEGIPEIENHSLIAENPNDFAENICLLYKDKTAWQKYSSGGRVLIEKHYTEAAARKLLEEILPFRDTFKLEQ